MTITTTDFTTNFPEFANPADYPVSVIAFYLSLGYTMLNPARWLDIIDYGVQLFVAHNLVLEFRAQNEAENGAPPGTSSGPLSSQSGGPLSISWDTGSAAEPNAGHWNESTYGKRYIRLARTVGAGGLQLGIGGFPGFQPVQTGPAWSGPPPWPGWFSS